MFRDMREHTPRRNPSLVIGMAVGRVSAEGELHPSSYFVLSLVPPFGQRHDLALPTNQPPTYSVLHCVYPNCTCRHIWVPHPVLCSTAVSRLIILRNPPSLQVMLTWTSETFSSAMRSLCISAMATKTPMASAPNGGSRPRRAHSPARLRAMGIPRCSVCNRRQHNRTSAQMPPCPPSYLPTPVLLRGQQQLAISTCCPTLQPILLPPAMCLRYRACSPT